MPYVEHKHFTPPADKNIKIWRYLDFTKFVSLLDQRALFFRGRIDSEINSKDPSQPPT